jgi:hypothetical protein
MTDIANEAVQPKTTKHRTHLAMGALVLAIGAGLYYGDALTQWGAAGDECLKFAADSDVKIAFDAEPGAKPFVASQWLKGRYVVVEMGQNVASKKGYYQSRLCVAGGGQIQIPSGLEQWEWR